MPLHTGEQWALDAGEEPDLEWCPMCDEYMSVDFAGHCVACGQYLDGEYLCYDRPDRTWEDMPDPDSNSGANGDVYSAITASDHRRAADAQRWFESLVDGQ